MAVDIPEEWRMTVSSILKEMDLKHIQLTDRTLNEFEALFPHASFTSDIVRSFLPALRHPLEGNPVYSMIPPGETYEFFYTHQGIKLYAKISLLEDGKTVRIYPSHRPLKGDTL